MNKEMLSAFMLWGDRANRDTSHMLDIVIAGTIDQLQGHGRVVLRPARLEEIVSRIAPRERDPDGGWVVTLLPAAEVTHDSPVNSRDVLDYIDEFQGQEDDDGQIAAFVLATCKPGVTLREIAAGGHAGFVEWLDERGARPGDPPKNAETTSAEVATMAGRILSAGDPFENDQVKAVLLRALDMGATPEGLAEIEAVLKPYIQNMMSIAGSALTQRG